MADYICLTLLSNPGEGEAAFKARLAAFWTHMLRNKPTAYEGVYAEATQFERMEDQLTRQYLVEDRAIDALAPELAAHGVLAAPVDRDETYSKYEATSPDWFQIEH